MPLTTPADCEQTRTDALVVGAFSAPLISSYVRKLEERALVEGPVAGSSMADGVAPPMMEYSTPIRCAAARLVMVKKKYPKFTAFSKNNSSMGIIRTVSTRLCPAWTRAVVFFRILIFII